MLAYHVDNDRLNRLRGRFYLQPMLRGQRCIVEWEETEPQLISSYGIPFKFMTHVEDALKRQLGKKYK